jgi:Leucine-rich repeat (LRR) protein
MTTITIVTIIVTIVGKTAAFSISLTLSLSLPLIGITQLQGFEKFITLSTIWLNDNKLQSIEGLEENIRLKGIHLYSNKIRKLKRRSFLPFKFLAVLTLNDNLLEDIDSTLRELKILKNLKSLDLFDNPIAEEDNYRLRVLSVLPSLEIFDRHRYGY